MVAGTIKMVHQFCVFTDKGDHVRIKEENGILNELEWHENFDMIPFIGCCVIVIVDAIVGKSKQ